MSSPWEAPEIILYLRKWNCEVPVESSALISFGWENNIRMDLREIGWEGVDWIHLGKDRNWWQTLVNIIMNFLVL
jgi:hypothetical protein